jgi:hypothetical protein
MMLCANSFLPVSAGHGEVARRRRDGGAVRALPLHHASYGPPPHAFGTGRII